jgi:hypothetical protein
VYVGDEDAPWDRADLNVGHSWEPYSASSEARDPTNYIAIQNCKIQNFSVIYRDSNGVYAGHTRNLTLTDTEISYGNYDGITIGTGQVHHLSTYLHDPPCSTYLINDWIPSPQSTTAGTCDFDNQGHPLPYNIYVQSVPPQTEGTKINRCNIHHVMMLHTDGGGIYMQGSHIYSLDDPNPPTSLLPSYILALSAYTGGRCASGELQGDYIHDIVFDPFSHCPAIYNVCHALYFENGSDGWHIHGNYVEHVQGMYTFAAPGGPAYGVDPLDPRGLYYHVPTAVWGLCQDTIHEVHDVHWQQTTWPVPWPFADQNSSNYMPAQVWYTGDPNYWLDVPGGAYGGYAYVEDVGPGGYGYPHTSVAGLGGMYALSPAYGGASNVPVTDSNTTAIKGIKTYAGPEFNVPNWFFPSKVKQIHRKPICSPDEPLDPASQVQ